jgi:proteasome alpha subunit
MLDEPYRWVEAIRNRREYLEDQLRGASPVVGLAYADGVLLLTTTPGPRKLFEVYNDVAFAAVGHPADLEKLRKAVIDIAHLEAFNLSSSDVSLQRLVHLGLGPLMKNAFDEIFRSPFIARAMVAELDPANPGERFYTIEADGSFSSAGQAAAVAGTRRSEEAIAARLAGLEPAALPLPEGLRRGLEAWALGALLAEREEENEPGEEEWRAFLAKAARERRFEAAVLDRGLPTRTKFRLLPAASLGEALAPYTS